MKKPMNSPEELKERIMRSLAGHPLDYQKQLEFIEGHPGWKAAGILLPLKLQDECAGDRYDYGVFILNKRSKKVQQGGDLCLPGGGPHPVIDSISSLLLKWRLLPPARSEGFRYAAAKSTGEFRHVCFFLSNALRESWEEIGLGPFNLEYLGSLNTYRLEMFRTIIFPQVCLVKRPWSFRPNWEVSELIELPVKDLFNLERYARYSIKIEEGLRQRLGRCRWEHPCFIIKRGDSKEILWGATYYIIQSFMKAVFGFQPPDQFHDCVVEGSIGLSYIRATRRRRKRED